MDCLRHDDEFLFSSFTWQYLLTCLTSFTRHLFKEYCMTWFVYCTFSQFAGLLSGSTGQDLGQHAFSIHARLSCCCAANTSRPGRCLGAWTEKQRRKKGWQERGEQRRRWKKKTEVEKKNLGESTYFFFMMTSLVSSVVAVSFSLHNPEITCKSNSVGSRKQRVNLQIDL